MSIDFVMQRKVSILLVLLSSVAGGPLLDRVLLAGDESVEDDDFTLFVFAFVVKKQNKSVLGKMGMVTHVTISHSESTCL